MDRRVGAKLVVLAAALISCSGATPAANGSPVAATAVPTQSPLVATSTPTASLAPIFDAHVHYYQEVWAKYPPERIAALLDEAGVSRVLVSSVPDEGTLRLRAALGERVVAELSPFKTTADFFSWARDGSTVPYVESIYRKGVHRGFGEFYLKAGETALPVVKAVLDFAAREKLFLHVHTDAAALSEMLNAVGPDKIVLWAHAGIAFPPSAPSATPAEIDALLAKWPKVSAELSYRDDVAPGGKLDPAWRELLVKYKDRFMVGTDPAVVVGLNCGDPRGKCTGTERWAEYPRLITDIRTWLGQLPPDVAEAIAHGNADRFFATPSP